MSKQLDTYTKEKYSKKNPESIYNDLLPKLDYLSL